MSLRELNNEELDCVEKYAKLLFFPSEIADILEVDTNVFLQAYKENEQNIQTKYKKGFLLAQVSLREKLFALACDGSNTAISEFLKLLGNTTKTLLKL